MLIAVFMALLFLQGCQPQTSRPNDSGANISGSGNSAGEKTKTPSTAAAATDRITICLLPKIKGISYFSSCARGAEEAARELGNVELIYDGPIDGDPKKQAQMIEQWTVDQVDVICVAPSAPDVVANAMKEAMAAGIHVLTWDADGVSDSRSFFVNQATGKAIGEGMVRTMVSDLGAETVGDVVIISSDATSANQNAWIEVMKPALEATKLKLQTIKYPGENSSSALADAQDVLRKYPDLKAIFGISSVAFPGAAEAVEQSGRTGQVLVTGLSTPNDMKRFVKSGTVRSFVLWNTADLGYLTVLAGEAMARGRLKPGDSSFMAGRLGSKQIEGDHILLGDIIIFSQDNIDQFDF